MLSCWVYFLVKNVLALTPCDIDLVLHLSLKDI